MPNRLVSKAKEPGPKKKNEKKRATGTAQPSTFPIVAIGASAGGLEAFSKLLRALPPESGLSLVFIPHLDPTHESALVELLSRTTTLPVHQAAEGMGVACNAVYVLPPNSDMTIADGVLHLAKREPGRRQHMPIDTFFKSLAADRLSKAVGVILSGTANDGTQGLASIRDVGGVTFAQASDSAKYDGMPNSAIAAGVVDYVLPPERIAEELTRVHHRSEEEPAKDAFDGKDGLMKDIFRLLKGFSKVDFVDYKVATIRRRILRRMHINHIADLQEYVKLLHTNPQEVESL
jgi:two-component system, chemotaxis family, CheB/CheR fusion protein